MNKLLYNKFTFIIICIISLTLLSSFVYQTFVVEEVTPLIDNENDDNFNNTIQLNILNGCGEAGLAAKIKEYFRKREFDVVEIGNFKYEVEKSLVIDRIGDLRSALKVARTIGVADTLVTTNIDSTMYLRTTLVIGKDWRNLEAFKE